MTIMVASAYAGEPGERALTISEISSRISMRQAKAAELRDSTRSQQAPTKPDPEVAQQSARPAVQAQEHRHESIVHDEKVHHSTMSFLSKFAQAHPADADDADDDEDPTAPTDACGASTEAPGRATNANDDHARGGGASAEAPGRATKDDEVRGAMGATWGRIRADLPLYWEELETDEGEPYYYNSKTKATSWDKPEPPKIKPKRKKKPAPQPESFDSDPFEFNPLDALSTGIQDHDPHIKVVPSVGKKSRRTHMKKREAAPAAPSPLDYDDDPLLAAFP